MSFWSSGNGGTIFFKPIVDDNVPDFHFNIINQNLDEEGNRVAKSMRNLVITENFHIHKTSSNHQCVVVIPETFVQL